MDERSVTVGAVGAVLRSAGLLREARGPEDVWVRGVTQDSRSVRPGDLFLAWRGSETDAHDFVPAAVRAGAVAAVVEHPLDVEVPLLVVSEGRAAGALAADFVMGSPWRSLFTAAVTGTNGKTTTALLARHLLEAAWPAVAIGTLGVVDAGGVRPGTEGLTTPGPARLSSWLAELASEGAGGVVLEASSHALDQRRLDGVRFDVGAFTSLGRDHLDYHRDPTSYFRAKARLVDLVRPDGVLAVNADDRAWDALDRAGRTVRTFGLAAGAEVRAESVHLAADGSRFDLVAHGASAPVHLPLPGRYNVQNALAAATVALVAGRSVEEVAGRLAGAPPVPGRLEVVHPGAFSVLIDFAHTPDALDNALSALRPLVAGRLIVLFGAGGDRDRTKRAPMAEAVRRHADLIVLTSDNPRTEDPERILDDLAEGLVGAAYHREVDRGRAIRHALSLAREGDAVLLAGKGHETYQIVGTERRPFDEREIVRRVLTGRGVDS